MIALLSLIAMLSSVVGAPSAASPHPVPTTIGEITRPYQLPATFRFAIGGTTLPNVRTIDGLSAFILQHRAGDDWVPTLKVPGKLKWSPITLRRGITSDNSLFEWRQKVIDGKIDEARTTCTLDALTPGGKAYEISLLGCYASSYEGPQRSAAQPIQAADGVTITFSSAEVRR